MPMKTRSQDEPKSEKPSPIRTFRKVGEKKKVHLQRNPTVLTFDKDRKFDLKLPKAKKGKEKAKPLITPEIERVWTQHENSLIGSWLREHNPIPKTVCWLDRKEDYLRGVEYSKFKRSENERWDESPMPGWWSDVCHWASEFQSRELGLSGFLGARAPTLEELFSSTKDQDRRIGEHYFDLETREFILSHDSIRMKASPWLNPDTVRLQETIPSFSGTMKGIGNYSARRKKAWTCYESMVETVPEKTLSRGYRYNPKNKWRQRIEEKFGETYTFRYVHDPGPTPISALPLLESPNRMPVAVVAERNVWTPNAERHTTVTRMPGYRKTEPVLHYQETFDAQRKRMARVQEALKAQQQSQLLAVWVDPVHKELKDEFARLQAIENGYASPISTVESKETYDDRAYKAHLWYVKNEVYLVEAYWNRRDQDLLSYRRWLRRVANPAKQEWNDGRCETPSVFNLEPGRKDLLPAWSPTVAKLYSSLAHKPALDRGTHDFYTSWCERATDEDLWEYHLAKNAPVCWNRAEVHHQAREAAVLAFLKKVVNNRSLWDKMQFVTNAIGEGIEHCFKSTGNSFDRWMSAFVNEKGEDKIIQPDDPKIPTTEQIAERLLDESLTRIIRKADEQSFFALKKGHKTIAKRLLDTKKPESVKKAS